MSLLILGFAALAALSLALFLLPELRRGAGLSRVSVLSALFVVVVAGITYQKLGAPQLAQPKAAQPMAEQQLMIPPTGDPEMDAALQGLVQRLEAAPDDVEGWVLFGRTLMQMTRFAAAADAFGEARARVATPDDELDLSYAEARILSDQSALTAAPGEIVERVLAANPEDVRALLYGGLKALAEDNNDVARVRFEKILTNDLPDELRRVVEERLKLAGGTPAERPAMAKADPSGAEPAAYEGLSPLTVSLSLGSDVPADAVAGAKALFVFARAPEGGPPIAVKRLDPSRLPTTVALSDADAMMPQRALSKFTTVTVVARLSVSGTPMAGSGDVFGERVVTMDDAGAVEIVLDQVTP